MRYGVTQHHPHNCPHDVSEAARLITALSGIACSAETVRYMDAIGVVKLPRFLGRRVVYDEHITAMIAHRATHRRGRPPKKKSDGP